MKLIGLVATFVVLLVAGSIWNGYVLSVMWGWFVVPTFDLPQLSIPAAIGASMVASYLTAKPTAHRDDRDSNEILSGALAHTFLLPLFAMGLGWIVNLWM